MALRECNRKQLQMFPPSIEQLVSEDAPVRVYDAFVEALDLKKLGIDIDPLKEGNPIYDPKTMLNLFNLWLFIRSTQFEEAGARDSTQSLLYLAHGRTQTRTQDYRRIQNKTNPPPNY